MGRTALMKWAYFLQTLRKVPLGYHFTLYSYGPFDSDVLFDLDCAQSMGLVDVSTVHFRGGYGYEIRRVKATENDVPAAREFLERYGEDIAWVLATFGRRSPAELELASTIIFVGRERSGQRPSAADLARRVHELKPHFAEGRIREEIEGLRSLGVVAAA
jgi:hypothetical protein